LTSPDTDHLETGPGLLPLALPTDLPASVLIGAGKPCGPPGALVKSLDPIGLLGV
jgi:hypothetical protein